LCLLKLFCYHNSFAFTSASHRLVAVQLAITQRPNSELCFVYVLFILLSTEFLWKSISDQVAHSKFTSFYQIVQLNEFIHSTYLLTIVDGNSVSSNCLDILQTRNSRLSFCMSYSGIGLCTWKKKSNGFTSQYLLWLH